MNVVVTKLPGIGVRKDFVCAAGRRVGVIDHRDGTIDLIVSKPDDPDSTAAQVSLTSAEAATMANLLGAPQLVAQLQEEHREVTGVSTKQLPVPTGSQYDGRTLGETEMRTRTSASIVAVMRAGQVIASPGPEFRFAGGDALVVVGTEDGLAAAAEILQRG